MPVLIGVGAVDTVVGRHDGLGVPLLHRDLKAGEVDLTQGALVHHRVGGHPAQLLGVGGKVLGAGGHTVFLNAPDIAGRHLARQIGVLGKIFEVAPAEGGALDVEPRAQHHAHPLGGGLRPQVRADLLPQHWVPGVGHGGGGGIAGGGQGRVQPQLVPLPGLLTDAVGAVGQGHVRHAQPLQAARLPEVLAGEEVTLLLQGHLLDDVRMFQANSSSLVLWS